MSSNIKIDFNKEKKLSYFREVQREMKRISWTSKKQLFVSTKVVVVSIFLFSLVIYTSDLFIKGVFSGIQNLAKMIFG